MRLVLRFVSARRSGMPWLAILAIASLLSACERASASVQECSSGKNTTAIEYGDSARISVAEVDQSIAHQLFEIRSAAATERVLLELLKSEAARRGLSVDELLEAEVDAKITAPSDEALRAFYEEQKSSLQSRSEPMPSFEEFKAQLSMMMERADGRARKEAFFDALISAARVRIDLDALGRPKPRFSPGGPSRGPADAKITIVEYTDFESPFCAKAQPTVEQILREFPREVRFVFRQNPQPEHPNASLAAIAVLCADDQRRYWDYRKALFSGGSNLSTQKLIEYATQLGLDLTQFSRCLEGDEKKKIVQREIEEARENGLEGSPVFSVNGTRLSGAHPIETFRRLIRFELPRK